MKSRFNLSESIYFLVCYVLALRQCCVWTCCSAPGDCPGASISVWCALGEFMLCPRWVSCWHSLHGDACVESWFRCMCTLLSYKEDHGHCYCIASSSSPSVTDQLHLHFTMWHAWPHRGIPQSPFRAHQHDIYTYMKDKLLWNYAHDQLNT